jgi:hypothetical protein
MLRWMVAKQLECVECGRESDELARGWLAIRCEDPERDGLTEIVFYCPLCTREFGVDLLNRPRRRRPPRES